MFPLENSLTSTVVPNVGFWAQATFLWITNGISGAITIDFAGNYAHTLDVRIRIWNGPFWTGARIRSLGVGACGPVATGIWSATFVYVYFKSKIKHQC